MKDTINQLQIQVDTFKHSNKQNHDETKKQMNHVCYRICIDILR